MEAGELPIWRGLSLSAEDLLRRAVIESIMCQGKLDFAAFDKRFEIDFSDYFAAELSHLQQQKDDGLIDLDEDGLQVTPVGRLLLRNVAMVFDQYLQQSASEPKRFSQVI